MTTIARKAASVFMAVLLCLGVAFSAAPSMMPDVAYAAEGGATLTVSGSAELSGKNVTIIKMFSAVPSLDGSSVVYTLEPQWEGFFKNLDDAGLADKTGEELSNAAIKYIQGLGDDNATKVTEFADKAREYVRANEEPFSGLTSTAEASASGEKASATFSNVGYGYYLAYPADGSTSVERKTDATLLNVLEESETWNIKSEYPTVDKTVQTDEDGSFGEAGSAQIGDIVTFKLTSTVPDMSDYDTYKFNFVDTMSRGLTYVPGSVEVTIGSVSDDTLTSGSSYSVIEPKPGEPDTGNNNTLTVSFADLKSISDIKPGDTITVTYKAMINENAMSTDSVTNEAKVEYSNNPTSDGTGTSTPDQTDVYTYDIDVHKYASDEETRYLAGAKFVLSKETTLQGTDPDYSNAIKLVSTGTGFRVAKPDEGDAVTSFTTNGTGAINISGLEAGTYYLHEVEAPAGYNKLTAPVKIVIAATDGGYSTPSYTVNDSPNEDKTVGVENSAGALLPGTGGMGTFALTVVGVIVVAAGVALVIRRNRKADQR